ncbi:MAG: short-chain dehydrogenase/reductase SDR [Candidatus Parvarchaeum acidiphilum ARMAN-4]|uniref:Short-chain dehydrogenase/reductase SDR n=1 Tax=Candidatus Parvarchaeum acidiphilum ARMAN-4 TaxID=662760 RepID=D2EGJ2_PARA4|nr:MAG: short-chain dehydrogenase/reductase SDR [Candidatus Parvarchaeum acidiphilum ARMAN-4]
MDENSKYLKMFDLTGKSAIVIGASSGLGISFTEALAEAGADVVICARRDQKLIENAERISKYTNRRIIPVKADLTNEEDIINVVKIAEEKLQKIDILINNAGSAVAGPSLNLKKEDWQKVLDVDISAVFIFSQKVISSMISHNVKGSIINIASIYGLFGDIIPAAPYYASKGAVVNLTRAMAVEFASQGIRVNAIAPGFFPSEMTNDLLKDKAILDHIIQRTPISRIGNPNELKGGTVFLASDAASYVTGHILAIDGGWSSV